MVLFHSVTHFLSFYECSWALRFPFPDYCQQNWNEHGCWEAYKVECFNFLCTCRYPVAQDWDCLVFKTWKISWLAQLGFKTKLVAPHYKFPFITQHRYWYFGVIRLHFVLRYLNVSVDMYGNPEVYGTINREHGSIWWKGSSHMYSLKVYFNTWLLKF